MANASPKKPAPRRAAKTCSRTSPRIRDSSVASDSRSAAPAMRRGPPPPVFPPELSPEVPPEVPAAVCAELSELSDCDMSHTLPMNLALRREFGQKEGKL